MDKVPLGQHRGNFNDSTVDDIVTDKIFLTLTVNNISQKSIMDLESRLVYINCIPQVALKISLT